ncbi:alpha/beta fold hydrolase [Agromyces sp. Marseille-P2726]|uniref:alpha/beta fold hydrolase n=1 Tax=Agromyces sp. Marseille-P2726 TaxID=2709132 RepID=UPI00157049CC|nr:alpha/beta hydrolase [Agromyces sp. Marseille-P2726]
MTEYVTSADGTRIAFDREGSGPPVILIGGAMQFRAFDPATVEMAHLLAGHGFTVVNYDRRGRGESPADAPITLAQTIDDLRALTDDLTEGADDAVALFGNSSGGSIALAAAAAGLPVSKLVFFEIPLDDEGGSEGAEYLAGLREYIAARDHDGAVEYYMRDMPREWLDGAKQSPAWATMVDIAPSLEPDAESLAWTQSAPRAELWRRITAPTLALVGEETLPIMTSAAASVVASMPNAQAGTVPAADHRWEPRTLALAIAEFLVGEPPADQRPTE